MLRMSYLAQRVAWVSGSRWHVAELMRLRSSTEYRPESSCGTFSRRDDPGQPWTPAVTVGAEKQEMEDATM